MLKFASGWHVGRARSGISVRQCLLGRPTARLILVSVTPCKFHMPFTVCVSPVECQQNLHRENSQRHSTAAIQQRHSTAAIQRL